MPKTVAVIVGLTFFMILWFCYPAGAERIIKMGVSAGPEMISGKTAYEIGNVVTRPDTVYRTHFPISRLEFPLDICMLTVKADISAANRLHLRAAWSRELTSDPGKLLNYDWETTPDALSIFSKSALTMDAEVLSGNLRYTLFSVKLDRYSRIFRETDQWTLFAGVGYRHQTFNFSASDTCQTYPGSRYYDDFDFNARVMPESVSRSLCFGDYFAGPTLTYSVEYNIPYLEVGFWLNQSGNAAAEVSIGYSPVVTAEDEDHHLLRYMHSHGDCEGTAFLLSIFYRYFWTNRWFSSAHLDYTILKTEGISQTFVNDTWSHTIDQEINSRQTRIGIDIGWAF